MTLVRAKLGMAIGERVAPGKVRYYNPTPDGRPVVMPRALAEVAGAEILGESFPETLPHAEYLAAAGIASVDEIPATVEELCALPGIGRGRAQQILAWLVDHGV